MNSSFKCQKIMSYNVFDDTLDSIQIIPNRKLIVNCINPHAYVVATKDPLFEQSLLASDIILPDGSGMVLAAKILNNGKIQKIAGGDFHHYLLQLLDREGGSVFYMGAAQKTLNLIEAKITANFSNIRVGTFSPPFKPVFSEEENNDIVEKINSFSPNLLFIGMTAPKQEKWLNQHKDRLNFDIAASIGAAFDFYAGTVVRPSEFWIKLHLEWLVRFLNEPKRLVHRNFVSTPIFLKDLLLYLLKIKR